MYYTHKKNKIIYIHKFIRVRVDELTYTGIILYLFIHVYRLYTDKKIYIYTYKDQYYYTRYRQMFCTDVPRE